jgi:hypothetical protein
MKITEIKITCGKEYFVMTPTRTQVVTRGRAFYLPEKLAIELFKQVALPAEKMVGELKDYKG